MSDAALTHGNGYAGDMQPKTTAQRQAQHRENNAGLRFDTYLSQEAHDAIDTLAAANNCTRKAAVENVVIAAASDIQGITMQQQMNISYWADQDEVTLATALAAAPNAKVRKAIQDAADEAANLRMYRADNRPASMTESERLQLKAFELEVAGQRVTERQVMIAGGQQAIDQKARVAESWTANNIHNQGK